MQVHVIGHQAGAREVDLTAILPAQGMDDDAAGQVTGGMRDGGLHVGLHLRHDCLKPFMAQENIFVYQKMR